MRLFIAIVGLALLVVIVGMLFSVLVQLRKIRKGEIKIMATEQQVKDKLTEVSTDLKAYKSAVDNYIASHPDASAEFDELLAQAKGIDDEVKADASEVPGNPPQA